MNAPLVLSKTKQAEQLVLQHPSVAAQLAEGFDKVTSHWYRSPDGTPLYAKLRLENNDGEKWIRPYHLAGGGIALGKPTFSDLGYTEGDPLYGLDLLATNPNATVYLVEGEKAADALNNFFAINQALPQYVATTSGSSSSYNIADVTPLKGRNVVIWPDADTSGLNYQLGMAKRLAGIVSGLDAMDIDQIGLPEKADAYDWLALNTNASICDFASLSLCMTDDLDKPLFDIASANVGSFLTTSPPPRRYLLDNCLPLGKVALLVGMGGVSKTKLAMAMQVGIATGLPVCDAWDIGEGGASLGLYAEEDEEELHRRIHAITAHLDQKQRQHVMQNVFIKSMTGQNLQLTARTVDAR